MVEVATVIRLSVLLLLLFAGTAKAFRTQEFAETIRGYRFVPARFAGSLSIVTVLLEFSIAVALFTGTEADFTFALAGLLFLCFAVTMAAATYTNPDSECGCLGGVVPLRVGWLAVAMNLVIVGAIVLATFEPLARAPFPMTGVYLPASEVSVMWFCALLFMLMYWLSVYAASVWRVINVGTMTNRQPLKLS